jgi:Na+-driven multidrug efflux pump
VVRRSVPDPPSIRGELPPLLRLAILLAVVQAGQSLIGVLDVAVLGRAGPILLGGRPRVGREGARFLGWRMLSLPLFFPCFAPRSYLQARGGLRPMLVAVVIANAVNPVG